MSKTRLKKLIDQLRNAGGPGKCLSAAKMVEIGKTSRGIANLFHAIVAGHRPTIEAVYVTPDKIGGGR